MYVSFKQLSGHLMKIKNYGNTIQLWYVLLILTLTNNYVITKFIGTTIARKCQ